MRPAPVRGMGSSTSSPTSTGLHAPRRRARRCAGLGGRAAAECGARGSDDGARRYRRRADAHPRRDRRGGASHPQALAVGVAQHRDRGRHPADPRRLVVRARAPRARAPTRSSIRTVEWVRDHGGNGIVNTIERWWYTNNPPPSGGEPDEIAIRARRATRHAVDPVYVPVTPCRSTRSSTCRRPRQPCADARAAASSRTKACGRPTGRTRRWPPRGLHHVRAPERGAHLVLHGSHVARHQVAARRLRRRAQRAGWRSRTRGARRSPRAERPTPIAAFNSGFKMDSANGGAYLDGQEIKPLRRRVGVVRDQEGRQRRASACGAVTSSWAPTSRPCARTSSSSSTTVSSNPRLREDDTTVFGATLGNKALCGAPESASTPTAR